MTIATPSRRPASYSTRGRRHAMVVPSASTWDGGLPVTGVTSASAPRTLRRNEPPVVEDTGGDRKDGWTSILLGALFGLTLTFGFVMGAQDDSFEQQPTHSFTVGASAVAH